MQIRYFNWQDNDSTFNLNMRLKGVLEHGRYRGFDLTPFAPASMTLILRHTDTGYRHVKQDLTVFPAVGTIITKQGVLVNETADISLNISPNTSGDPRIDIIVCEHEYLEIVGGIAATYSVIQGTPAPSPVAPALTDPDKQVIIGTLVLQDGTTSLDSGATYVQSPTPFLGNDSRTFDTAISGLYGVIASLNLNSLTDVTLTSQANGDIMVYNGSQWVNVGATSHIQGLQLFMTRVFGQSGIEHVLDTENMQSLIGGGPDEWGYVVTKNFARWQLGSASVKRISRLTDLPIGTVIRMSFSSPSIAGFVMAGAGDYGVTILDTHGRSGFIAVVPNIIYTFVRRNLVWMMSEEMPRPDYAQTDPTALNFIQNKPAIVNADWTQANPASPAFIQNKPNVIEVLARFTLQVGNVGGLTVGAPVTVVNSGAFTMQCFACSVGANTGGNTQQSSSLTVSITNPNSESYMVLFVVYSIGTAANDAIAYPTLAAVNLTNFSIGLKEVITNSTSNINIQCILIKSPVSL